MANNFTLEQLRNLKDLEASPTPGVKISVFPQRRGSQSQGLGSNVTWVAWLFRKGVQGPSEVAAEELEAAGLDQADAEAWADRTRRAVVALNRLYPAISEAKVTELERAARGEFPQAVAPQSLNGGPVDNGATVS